MAPVQNGQWSIDFISPGQAYVPSAGLVSVYGSFPADSFVWFGDSAATPVFSSSNFLLVMLPRITTPGTVDVSLRTASQTVLVAPSAFRFLEPDVVTTPPTSGPGSVTTTTIQGVTPTTAPGGVTTTTVLGVTPTSGPGSVTTTTVLGVTPTSGPGGVTTTTVLGVSTTMAPGGVTTTTTQGATPTPVQFQFGTPLVLGNGLRVSPLTQPAAPTGAVSVANWSTRSCSTTMCQSTRL